VSGLRPAGATRRSGDAEVLVRLQKKVCDYRVESTDQALRSLSNHDCAREEPCRRRHCARKRACPIYLGYRSGDESSDDDLSRFGFHLFGWEPGRQSW
jgi:hypothetical protein